MAVGAMASWGEPMNSKIKPGLSHPLGATLSPEGANFSIYSKNATGMELLLFDEVSDSKPARKITLDPAKNRTYDYWHVFVAGLKPGQVYGYRAQGSFEPQRGLRFDHEKVLLDPYARAVALPQDYSRRAATQPGDNAAQALKGVIADLGSYDWEGDTPLKRHFAQTVIYELHVGGFTRHPSSGVAPEKRGTFAGLVEKIPYLQDLGVTAVELLPVFQFDEQDAPAGLSNYWGYSPVSFFAPHQGYSFSSTPLAVLDQFRDMVKALHRAGIEVILDVVFNHTAEGNHLGPTLNFRGLENEAYYILEKDRATYANYSGTGNTLNANHPVVRRLISDSLRHWVQEMHVDGFRFDLASILSRDESGTPLANPPIIWDIDSDPVLAGIKLIAEAWDAAGLYQVGTFVGDFWKEWNGRFRDDVRTFLRGDQGTIENLACRLLGSGDVFHPIKPETEQSINFITSHDGFTLNDLVSYGQKHNEANRQDNRDGSDDNLSWNCGREGPTDDPEIEKLRSRQVKNFLAVTLLAMGTPMLLMGNEVRRTQQGNNNAYCQDNELSWLNWTWLEKYPDIHRFVRRFISIRLHPGASAEKLEGLTLNQIIAHSEIQFHGVHLNQIDWDDDDHSLALTVLDPDNRPLCHLIFNAYGKPLEFELPPLAEGEPQGWYRWLDTNLESPDDLCPWAEAQKVTGSTYLAQPHSVVGLIARGSRGSQERI
jgi:isoamylase